MQLLFVRHGESTWNIEGRFQGQLDPPLSPLGERQAHAVAEQLAAREHPAAIVSSPLQRARRTAEIIGHRCGLSVAFDDRLVEISHGEWQGLLRTEIAQRWPRMVERWRDQPEEVRFPGGETLAEVQGRLLSFLAGVRDYASPLVVCTHDVIVRLAVLWATGDPISGYNLLKTENAGITVIYLNGRPRLVGHNDVGHLGQLRSDLASQAL